MIRSSTVAARRKTAPGIQNVRDVMWESEEREEEDAWKCILRDFMFTDQMAPEYLERSMTSGTSVRGSE